MKNVINKLSHIIFSVDISNLSNYFNFKSFELIQLDN